MSMSQFPADAKGLTRENVINQILTSIAMEELGISHVLNAEGEKIKFVLGELEGSKPMTKATIDEVLKVNQSVQNLLEIVTQQQILLKQKMVKALNASAMQCPPCP